MAYKKSLKIIKIKIEKKEQLEKKLKRYHDVPPLDIEYLYTKDNCLCTDKNYQFKDIYPNEHEAEQQAKYLNDILGINISVYPCPYNTGWHLTQR